MITPNELKHIAKLARIEIPEKDLDKFRSDLDKILEYIEALKTVNTDGVEPLASVTGQENTFRKDEAEKSELSDDILKNAPDTAGRFIRVKKVL